MRSYGWALVQDDWCPNKKRLGHEHTKTLWRHKEKTAIHTPVKRVDLGLLASRNVRK